MPPDMRRVPPQRVTAAPLPDTSSKYAHMQVYFQQYWDGSNYVYTDFDSDNIQAQGASGIQPITLNNEFGPALQVNEAGLYICVVEYALNMRITADAGPTNWSRMRMQYAQSPPDSFALWAGVHTEQLFIGAMGDAVGSGSNMLAMAAGERINNPSITFVGAARHNSLEIVMTLAWYSPTTRSVPLCS